MKAASPLSSCCLSLCLSLPHFLQCCLSYTHALKQLLMCSFPSTPLIPRTHRSCEISPLSILRRNIFLKFCFTSFKLTCLSLYCLHALSYLYSPEEHPPTLCLNMPTNERGASALVGDIIFVRHIPIYGSETLVETLVFCNLLASPRNCNQDSTLFSQSPLS